MLTISNKLPTIQPDYRPKSENHHQQYKPKIMKKSMSSHQSDITKENIINWCKEDNIPCNDESSLNPQFTWSLTIGDPAIIVYKQPHLPDRIYIQSQIKIAPEHQTLIKDTWNVPKRNTFVVKLQSMAANLDVNMNFKFDKDGIMTSISSFKVHFHSTISKADFLQLFLRVQGIHRVLLNQLIIELGLELQQEQQKGQAGSDNPLSG